MAKVNLRYKTITGGRKSLYLDYYPPIYNPEKGKKTRRRFLKLFIYVKPKDDIKKEHNSETIALAERIRAQTQLDLQNNHYGFLSSKVRGVDIVTYFKELAEKRKSSNHDNWISALNYIIAFFGKRNILVSELTEKDINDFKEYLLEVESVKNKEQKLSRNSTVSYFNKLKATLKQAYRDGLLRVELNSRIERIKSEETAREYLSIEELRALVRAECEYPLLKQAALFSAMTGLRFCDIQQLTWGHLRHSENSGYCIHFRQKKTGGVEVMPISDEAVELLGSSGLPEVKIFKGLRYSAYNNINLRRWIMNADIKKNITFHNFRHTFATLQLSLGTDIYTVSKMLGHRDLKTTQVYAKVIDKKKRDAANKISLKTVVLHSTTANSA